MTDAFTGSNYYKHSLTEYEVEAYERDVAFAIAEAKTKHTNDLAALDAEIVGLETEIAAAKTKRINSLAAKDAEIADLESQLAKIKAKCA